MFAAHKIIFFVSRDKMILLPPKFNLQIEQTWLKVALVISYTLGLILVCSPMLAQKLSSNKTKQKNLIPKKNIPANISLGSNVILSRGTKKNNFRRDKNIDVQIT
jgi:hypothetical protein